MTPVIRLPGRPSASVITFLTVGGLGYLVDVVAFNGLRATPTLGAADPAYARVLAMCLAMVVTYVGNRRLVWRARPAGDRRREIMLFVVFNLAGLVLSLVPLVISHDVLGFTSRLADNVAANGVGVVLGTAFRYWGYERFVFGVHQVRRPALWRRRRLAGGALVVVALAALAGCRAEQQSDSVQPPSQSPAASPAESPTHSPAHSATHSPAHSTTHSTTHSPARTAAALPSKVLVVIEENHSLAQMRTGMPFLAGLSDQYGYAMSWTALTHPSEPNYLAIVGGSTFGVTDDAPPSANQGKVGSAPSVFGQALGAGKTAATYAESMQEPCALADNRDRSAYAVRHNPWTYFTAERAACRAHDVDLSTFAGDAADNALPNVGFLIPDLTHDAHDASLADADAWLREQLTPVLHSDDFSRGRLVVVVTADEDDRRSGNVVLTSVLTPRLHQVVVDEPLTHYSLTRFIDAVIGQAPLGQAEDAPDMAAAFGL